MQPHVEAHLDPDPSAIRQPRTEAARHTIEVGSVPRDEALPSSRALAGCLGINPHPSRGPSRTLVKLGLLVLAGPRVVGLVGGLGAGGFS